MNDNTFVNKELFSTQFDIDNRKKRLDDFEELYKLLHGHLEPMAKPIIDKKEAKKYISLYKEENKELVLKLLGNTKYVPFEKFYSELKDQVNRFNQNIDEREYIMVLGVGNAGGGTLSDFSIFKSNFWICLLVWPLLKTKPYDIIFNLNVAIKLYFDKAKDYVILDDMAYSGSQLIYGVLEPAAAELNYHVKNSYVNFNVSSSSMFKPVLDKVMNVHIIVPFFSTIAYTRLSDLDLTTGFNFIKYISYIVNPYRNIFTTDELTKLDNLYKQYYQWINLGQLIPIYFQHKIADALSTIDLILIKGQVLDDPTKKHVFIKECKYDPKKASTEVFNPSQENFTTRKIYCPIPPYVMYEKVISKQLKREEKESKASIKSTDF